MIRVRVYHGAAMVVAALALLSGAARAGSHFDATSDVYQSLPAAGQKFIEKVAAAADGEKVKAFVALASDSVDVGGTIYSRARLAAAIKQAGGIAKGFALEPGTWVVEPELDGYAIHRGDSTVSFTVGPTDGVFEITIITQHLGTDIPMVVEPLGCDVASSGDVGVATPVVTGGLDPKVVRRYFKRNMQKFGYCYQQRLQVVPDLAGGTVSTQLTIAADGTVRSSSSSGVDEDVAGCVDRAVRGIEFPKPSDGGSVVVTADIHVGIEPGQTWQTSLGNCAQVPEALRAHADKLAAALDQGDDKAFLALLPATVAVHGKKLGKAKIRKLIAKAGSAAAWLGMARGNWVLEQDFDDYRLYQRGDALVLRKSGSRWRVRAVIDRSRSP